MRATRKHGIRVPRNAQTKCAKVQKITALFQGSALLYICVVVEYCSAAAWSSSSINLCVIRRTRLWHGPHPEQGWAAHCALGGKRCMGLAWNTLLCIMSGARRVLLGRHGQVPGHTRARVSGDSGPLSEVPPAQRHLPPHHQHLAVVIAVAATYCMDSLDEVKACLGVQSPQFSLPAEYWTAPSRLRPYVTIL